MCIRDSTRIIAADPVLADAKITNYQEVSKTQETFFDKDTLTDEEKKIDQDLSRLVFEDSKGSKLFFELQVLDRLDEYKNLQNGDSISPVSYTHLDVYKRQRL